MSVELEILNEENGRLRREVATYKAALLALEKQEPFGIVVEYRNVCVFYKRGESPYLDNSVSHHAVYLSAGAAHKAQEQSSTLTSNQFAEYFHPYVFVCVCGKPYALKPKE